MTDETKRLSSVGPECRCCSGGVLLRALLSGQRLLSLMNRQNGRSDLRPDCSWMFLHHGFRSGPDVIHLMREAGGEQSGGRRCTVCA